MLVVDASCLYEFLIATPAGRQIEQRLALDDELFAPHVVDVEVLGLLRRQHRLGRLDRTAAELVVNELAEWPGVRVPHSPLLRRAWQLRDNVRAWDAMYVALAEALGAILLTSDARLAAASGPNCEIELFGAG